jgi:AmiR/NasT family two-component response regulator
MTAQNEATSAGSRRVLIVEDDTLVGLGIRAHLERLGHQVVGQAATEAQAVEMFRTQQPDLVIMDIRLSDADGIEVSKKLMAERRSPIVVVSAFSDAELIKRAADAGVFGYLIKPATLESLAAQIVVATQRFAEHTRLLEEKSELASALETRKLVERAKGILMKRLNLTEPDAHRKLQIESQKRRIGIAEIARKVIESEKPAGSL